MALMGQQEAIARAKAKSRKSRRECHSIRPVREKYQTEELYREAFDRWEDMNRRLIAILMEEGSVVISAARYHLIRKRLPHHERVREIREDTLADIFIVRLKREERKEREWHHTTGHTW